MKQASRIEGVIFDLGNVLVSFDHRIAVKRIAKFTDKSPEEIFNLFFDSEITGLFEEGKLSAQDFFLKVKEMLNLKIDFNTFLPIWNEIFFLTDTNRAVYDIAATVKKRCRIALLSNINVLHFDYLKDKFPVFDVFDHIITSFEVGQRKPHPLIYKKATDMLEVSSLSRVFYTDDRADLVAEASELGLRGFVFKDAAKLKQDLQSAGVSLN